MKTNRLDHLLYCANRLLLVSALAGKALQAMCVFLVALLVMLAIDAVFGLKSWGLVTLDVLLMGLIAMALIYLAILVYRGRYEPHQMAIVVEQRLGLPGSHLINAVDLSTRHSGGQSERLREYAVEQGDALAAKLSPASVVDRHAIWRAARATGLALLVFLIAYLAVPGVFRAVLPRLLNPTADHPPFTLVKFSVSLEPQTAIFGRPASIRAALSGPTLPHQATVVFVDDDDRHQHLPMLRTTSAHAVGTDATNAIPQAAQTWAHFLLRLDRAERSRDFFIDTPQGRSKRYRMTVLPVPQFERVSVAYSYPPYTGWEASIEPMGPAGIRALEGTKVTITVTSNVDLKHGSLVVRPKPEKDEPGGEPMAVTLSAGSAESGDRLAVQGTFALAASGRYELSLVGADGTPSNETLSGSVMAVPDHAPEVYISEPGPRVIVPEGWAVDVQVDASDDVAVDRLVLHRDVNGWGPTPTDLQLTGTERTHMTAGYRFDLAQLGAEAGDVITYFATAYDNHPDGGQLAQTPTYAIQVISEEDYFEYARTQYRMEELMEELADIENRLEDLRKQREEALEQIESLLAQLEEGEPLTDEQRRRIQDLEAQLADFATEADALAGKLQDRIQQPDLYDFEDQYKQMLQRLASQLRNQAEMASALNAAASDLRQNDSPQLRNALGARGLRFKETDQPFCQSSQQERQLTEHDLEKYRLADAIFAEAERIRSVVEYQQDLAKRLAQFRNRDNLTRAQQRLADKLASEQALLRQELQDAKEGLLEAARDAEPLLPGMSADAVSLCGKIDALEIDQEQRTAEQTARAGQGREAHAAAQSVGEKLDSLLSDCPSSSGDNDLGELCDSLKLPRYIVANSLKQLSQGRALPGMGQQGSSGVGFSGSMVRMAVVGPAAVAQGTKSFASAGRIGGRGRGTGPGQGFGGDDQAAAEALTSVQTTERGRGATAMSDVPLRYREDAEAYFRRLAEESR